MSDSIFEIREYLDSDGKVSKHDVTDISKELSYMEKLVDSMQQGSSALSEEDQFIRELALLAEEKGDSLSGEDLDNEFFSSLEATEAQRLGRSVEQAPVSGEVKKVKATKDKSGGGGGWSKGFLDKGKAKVKAPASGVASTGTKAVGVDECTQNSTVVKDIETTTKGLSINEASLNTTTSSSASVPLKGILKNTSQFDTSPATPATTNTATPSTTPVTSTPTSDNASMAEPPTANTAFSGSILERAPAKTVAKLSSGVILGGKKKPV